MTNLTVSQAALLGAAIALLFAFLIIGAVLIVFYYRSKQVLATFKKAEKRKTCGVGRDKAPAPPPPPHPFPHNVSPPPPPPGSFLAPK
jgi:hypothetical protein